MRKETEIVCGTAFLFFAVFLQNKGNFFLKQHIKLYLWKEKDLQQGPDTRGTARKTLYPYHLTEPNGQVQVQTWTREAGPQAHGLNHYAR